VDFGNIAYHPGHWIIRPANRTAPATSSTVEDQCARELNTMRQHKVLSLDRQGNVHDVCLGHCYEAKAAASPRRRWQLENANLHHGRLRTGKCMASFRYGRGHAGICSDGQHWTSQLYRYPARSQRSRYRVGRLAPGAHHSRNVVVGDPTTTLWRTTSTRVPSRLLLRRSIDQTAASFIAIVDSIAIAMATAVSQATGS